MVGVVEAVAFPVCCAPAENTSSPHVANASGIKDTWAFLHTPVNSKGGELSTCGSKG